jgi:hypothetical protein
LSSAKERKQQKLKKLERLRGLMFRFAKYRPPSADWDHDHCDGCWAKFALFDAPEILHSGYFTITQICGQPTKEPEFIQQARESGHKVLAKPDTKEWVCPKCFHAFRKTMAWKLKSKPQS